jgi:hypothetical protein
MTDSTLTGIFAISSGRTEGPSLACAPSTHLFCYAPTALITLG